VLRLRAHTCEAMTPYLRRFGVGDSVAPTAPCPSCLTSGCDPRVPLAVRIGGAFNEYGSEGPTDNGGDSDYDGYPVSAATCFFGVVDEGASELPMCSRLGIISVLRSSFRWGSRRSGTRDVSSGSLRRGRRKHPFVLCSVSGRPRGLDTGVVRLDGGRSTSPWTYCAGTHLGLPRAPDRAYAAAGSRGSLRRHGTSCASRSDRARRLIRPTTSLRDAGCRVTLRAELQG
jgi:hypothetical protein